MPLLYQATSFRVMGDMARQILRAWVNCHITFAIKLFPCLKAISVWNNLIVNEVFC